MNSTIYRKIGLRVRALRRHSHRTQQELGIWLRAFGVPVTRDIIANWETGRSEPPAHVIRLLAYVFKVDIADILPNLAVNELIARIPPRNHKRIRRSIRLAPKRCHAAHNGHVPSRRRK